MTCSLPIRTPPGKRRRLSRTWSFRPWILDPHLGDIQAAFALVLGYDLVSHHCENFIEQASRKDESLSLGEHDVVLIVANRRNGMQRSGDLHDLDFLGNVPPIFLLHADGRPAPMLDGLAARAIEVANLVAHDLHAVRDVSWVATVRSCAGICGDLDFDLVGCSNLLFIFTRFGHHIDVLREVWAFRTRLLQPARTRRLRCTCAITPLQGRRTSSWLHARGREGHATSRRATSPGTSGLRSLCPCLGWTISSRDWSWL